MPDRQWLIPLFPLNVALFPNGFLPLHIFEERYKLMVQRCLEGDSEFGVALIKTGVEVGGSAEPYPVGTVARIVDVKRADDGRMNIIVRGGERFRIEMVTQDTPYMEGLVSVLDEDRSERASAEEVASARLAAAEQIRLLHGLRGGWCARPENAGGSGRVVMADLHAAAGGQRREAGAAGGVLGRGQAAGAAPYTSSQRRHPEGADRRTPGPVAPPHPLSLHGRGLG